MAETKIYIADTAPLQDEAVFAGYYELVSERRKEKIDRMRFQKGRCLSLGVEILLMEACREFGVSYQEETVLTNRYSKPCFRRSGVQFNLSHSGERVMCMMSENPVGCDVEQTGRPDLKIAKRFFSDSEKAEILSCAGPDAQAACFYRFWTLKESFIKCVGQGLYLPLDAFSISLEGDPRGRVQTIDGVVYSLGEYNPGDGYQYAWCMKHAENASGASNAPKAEADIPVIRSVTFH